MTEKTSVITWYDVKCKMPPQGTRVLYRDGLTVGEGYTNCRDTWFRHEGYELSLLKIYPTHWSELPSFEY